MMLAFLANWISCHALVNVNNIDCLRQLFPGIHYEL